MISISLIAKDDLVVIAAGIRSFNELAASKWIDGIQDVFEMLDRHPDVGEYRTDFGIQGCRSFTFGKYVIFFRRLSEGTEIARVIHSSRDIQYL